MNAKRRGSERTDAPLSAPMRSGPASAGGLELGDGNGLPSWDVGDVGSVTAIRRS